MPTLTPHQETAIAYVVDRLTSGHDLVALRGLAGTGKTTLIPVLREALQAKNLPTCVGSPTHRAAMILRRKGIKDADTIHSHALTPYFKEEYAECLWWLGEPCPTHGLPLAQQFLDGQVHVPRRGAVPLLLEGALHKRQVTTDELRTRHRSYKGKRVLESVGLHGRDWFDGFGPKNGEGVLIVDEASMMGRETLRLCQEAFPLVCLVGDPGQLPPVKEDGILAEVEGIDLTEIHRQAGDSPIITLAYAARERRVHWNNLVQVPGELTEWLSVPATEFLTSPLIVWRNKIRESCTQAIRAALGYPADRVVPGEPLVCRSSNEEDRAEGFINNTLWRVVKADPDYEDPTAVLVRQDMTDDDDDDHAIFIHIEELHGEAIHPKAIPFRFGYCLTAHTAQGGEWPTVYIAKKDMLAYLRTSAQRNPTEGPQWAYTAITRARTHIAFLQEYDFTTWRPTQGGCMPKMTAADTEPAAPVAIHENGSPPTDDITDPTVPLQTIADLTRERAEEAEKALAPDTETLHLGTFEGRALLNVDQACYKISEHAATCLNMISNSWDAAVKVLNQNNSAFLCLKEALQSWAPHTPYSATIAVLTPSGFPMTLTVEALNQDEFLGKVGALMGFLKEGGFTPQVP